MTGAVRAWAPAVVWAALIFAASSRSTLPVDLELQTDKLAHFATYAVLGVALAHAQRRSGLHWGVGLALGLLYGISDELHQSFVPGRSAELGDWIADALGVAAGLIVFHRWRDRRPQRGQRRTGAVTRPSAT